MKGDLALKVLERLSEVVGSFVDLSQAILEAGYSASPGRIAYLQDKLEAKRWQASRIAEERRRAQRRHYNLVAWLTRDGLVQRNDKKQLRITAKGLRRLELLRKNKLNVIPAKTYVTEKSEGVVIVAFDIPEEKRRTRDWLRATLRDMGFTLLQRSVWIGKFKIPQAFLEDIAELELAEAVEIFEVGKHGSLRRLTSAN